jgi:hypothetical protein
MSASVVVGDVMSFLQRRYGQATQSGKSRLFTFGSALTCSINYSKLLGGHKYFFGVAKEVADPEFVYPKTEFGDFALLVCGSAENILVLPRSLVLSALTDVPTRRLDVFCDQDGYILQTTQHPKLSVTELVNAFPEPRAQTHSESPDGEVDDTPDRLHVQMQWALIQLGRAEGRAVWVPPHDRGLSYRRQAFTEVTLARLPGFGFEERTRRIVQNIDILWLERNVILKAFEIESTTAIYSGLLRLNDLVLAQPNNQIDLYIAAPRTRRNAVHAQLIRPSVQQLIPQCQFAAFELIEEQFAKVQALGLDSQARVSGLIRGERFELPDYHAYPS